jgi:hypothetical protein
MTLDQYANLFEIVGGAIVVVTLIFLVVQIRQNTHALRSATVLGSHNTTLTVYGMMVQDSMIQVLCKGMPQPSGLSTVEKAKFHAFWTATLQNYQQTYFQIRAGAYDESLYDGWWQVLRDNFLSPGFQLHWKQRKFILSREFQDFVEQEVLTRTPTADYAESVSKRTGRESSTEEPHE